MKQALLVCQQLNSFSIKSDSELLNIGDYMEVLNIAHINLFKLNRFFEETKLANKLQGFSEQFKMNCENTSEATYISTHSSPLRKVEQILNALATPDEDGRIVLSIENGIKYIKYLLLNPTNSFQDVLKSARSVIFAGGTMAPMADFIQQVKST